MVTLRGNFWNTLWPNLELLSKRLEELGIGDEAEVNNV